jgi:UDP-glucose 4-epimerase
LLRHRPRWYDRRAVRGNLLTCGEHEDSTDCLQSGERVDNENILVIGGAGYVGSHFAHYALKEGYRVTVADNLSTGHRGAVRDAEFVPLDLLDGNSLQACLAEKRFHTIFHFAASCLVPESVADPSKYYRNNVVAATAMLEAMRATGHDRLVFSSTCAVYGIPQSLPIREDSPKNPSSPYGRTKLAIEWMLEDYHAAYGLRWAALRYFNAAGCEPAVGLGEDHEPETHLIPNVVRHALKPTDRLVVFGSDYPTRDGTCIRDYIHVTDLAEAHIKAMEKLDVSPQIRLNLGTGSGHSNLEVVQAVSRVARVALRPEMGPRRPGDPPELVADPSEAFRLLQWHPSRSDLDKMVQEVLTWRSEHPRGYDDR